MTKADGAPFKGETIMGCLAVNEELAAHKRDIPLDAILEELDAICQELVAAANRLSAEQWEQAVLFPWGDERPVAEMLDELSEHEMEHVRAIQQWRGD